ncbi:hypothetical protein EBB07_33385 [Paenibacillaceae bacterium]|nr:hypothetical protein EBB07_33385 [Paenibacillaceae bacterium]
MVKCQTNRDLLSAYMIDTMPAETAEVVERHLAGCPECRAWHLEAAELAAELRAEWDNEALFEPFPELTDAIMADIDQLSEHAVAAEVIPLSTKTWQRRLAWIHYGVAAGLTLLLFQFGIFEQWGNGINEMNLKLADTVEVWAKQSSEQ